MAVAGLALCVTFPADLAVMHKINLMIRPFRAKVPKYLCSRPGLLAGVEISKMTR